MRATTLWYNGDFNLSDAATDESIVPINVGGTYELNTQLAFNDFVVPAGQIWSLTSIFSNQQIAYHAAISTAGWQIRKGMSVGNGGTLVASGDSTATSTQTTAADNVNYIDSEFRLTSVISTTTLTAGTYWVAIAPDSVGYYGDQAYIETTSGANAIGTPAGNNGNSFLFSNLNGPGSENYVASSLDYSEGVVGTATAAPEPSGLLSIIGLAGMPLLAVRRRRPRPAGAAHARPAPPTPVGRSESVIPRPRIPRHPPTARLTNALEIGLPIFQRKPHHVSAPLRRSLS